MITLEQVETTRIEEEAAKLGVTLPIEQTQVWVEYQNDIPDRKFWGSYLIKRDGDIHYFHRLSDARLSLSAFRARTGVGGQAYP